MDLPILVDVAIGLSLVYMVASLFVTITNEYVAQVFNLRGSQLATDLTNLIADPEIRKKLTSSPALAPFFQTGRESKSKRASYVDPSVLAHMLTGSLAASPAGQTGAAGQTGQATAMQAILDGIGRIGNDGLKNQLLALAVSANNDVDRFVKNVAAWADQSLTMLGEVYKKNTQLISLGLGLAVAGFFNLDTLAISSKLYLDKEAREATSAAAVALVEKASQEALTKCTTPGSDALSKDPACAAFLTVGKALKQQEGAFGKLPIGWPARLEPAEVPEAEMTWFSRILGWVLTALAVSLGASFWFDLLKRLVNIRHGMRRPEAPAPATK